MPELPDVVVYREMLERRLAGKRLARLDIKSPFLVRTFDPDVYHCQGKTLTAVERLGKRFVLRFDEGPLLVIHLMIAGRFHARKPGVRPKSKTDLAAFHFSEATDDAIVDTIALTEASPKKRASLHAVADDAGLAEFDRGGLDVLSADEAAFAERLRSRNHTLKRALTDPRLFDGVGNAYSDEILHAAGLSPIKWTSRLDDDEVARLFAATRDTLGTWIERLRGEANGVLPEKVTAFHAAMAVHGKFRQPCPVCETQIQRIRYASNETNYCPRCQTGGKLLADRSMSRLLKGDWPKTIEELEES